MCKKRLGFGRQQETKYSIFFRDVSRVIRGVQEKAWFRQADSQETKNSIFFRDVNRVIRGVQEKAWLSN